NYTCSACTLMSDINIINNVCVCVCVCVCVLDRPSRKLRCCDRTNSRKFNDSPQIQCEVAILTHHRNFPANLTNHCRLPQLSPFCGYTKGGNSALWTRCRHSQSSNPW